MSSAWCLFWALGSVRGMCDSLLIDALVLLWTDDNFIDAEEDAIA